jgi:inosine-uridine nucleoside N-ribohydrolase
VRFLRFFLVAVVVLAAVIGGWWIWHVNTVDLPLVVAPRGLVHLPQPQLGVQPLPVWIDTDAACGTEERRDVDDCWAIAAAARSNRIAIRGITTIFGNADATTSANVARAMCTRFGCDVQPTIGAERAGDPATAAVEALAAALRRERLFILSLGPATNIAAALKAHPDLASRVLGVIAIAGGTEMDYFDTGSRIFHAHDQNFRRDIPAFETLLNAKVPIVLIPYDTTKTIVFTADDLARLSDPQTRWLADASREWLDHWTRISDRDGFVPFDAVAVAYLLGPDRFRIARQPVQIRRPVSHAPEQFLLASPEFDRGWVVSYAYDVAPETADLLLSVIGGRH